MRRFEIFYMIGSAGLSGLEGCTGVLRGKPSKSGVPQFYD